MLCVAHNEGALATFLASNKLKTTKRRVRVDERDRAVIVLSSCHATFAAVQTKMVSASDFFTLILPSSAFPKCTANLDTSSWAAASFDDPPPASAGTDAKRMAIFRRVRDELRAYLADFAKAN